MVATLALSTAPALADELRVSEMVAALERAWNDIAAATRDGLPEVAIVIASGSEGHKVKRWGHFANARWIAADGARRGEVLIAAERLAHGPIEVLGTLIHEAAHALADARGVQDTSRQGRYHNERYKLIAEELGLTVGKDDRYGWTVTRMSDAAVEQYRGTLDDLTVACVAFRHDPDAVAVVPPADPTDGDAADEPADEAPTKPTGRILIVCGCPNPRKLRISPSVLDEGSISCGVCGVDFEPAITV